jgi:serine/threonine protein kinase
LPNLIRPIASYYQSSNGDKCLIFPWATGGNLGEYWEKHKSHSLVRDRILWILEQFEGISLVLEALHIKNVRHGDLKPENILLFEDQDLVRDNRTLQIADLGLAKIHDEDLRTIDRKDKTTTPPGTRRYEPPEMDQDRNTQLPRSRQYDMRSFGCILLELLIWLGYGFETLQEFRKKKNTEYFWVMNNGVYEINPVVVRCMSALDDELTGLDGDTAQQDILRMVRDSLLVIKVAQDYNKNPKDDERENAKQIHGRMREILRKCRTGLLPHYLRPVRFGFDAKFVFGEQLNSGRRPSAPEIDGRLAPELPRGVPAAKKRLPPSPLSQSSGLNGDGVVQGDDAPRVLVRQATEPQEAFSMSGLGNALSASHDRSTPRRLLQENQRNRVSLEAPSTQARDMSDHQEVSHVLIS